MNMIKTIFRVLVQLAAFAHIDGIWIALLWTASFAAVISSPESIWGALLALATPLVAGQRLKSFRNHVWSGAMPFSLAYVYLCYIFVYASILFAAVQLVYFRYLDHGAFMATLASAIDTVSQAYQQQGLSAKELYAAMSTMRQTPDTELVLSFFVQNLIVCGIVAMPTALLLCRGRKPTTQNNDQ